LWHITKPNKHNRGTSEGNNQMIKPIAKMVAGLNRNLLLSENASSSVNM